VSEFIDDLRRDAGGKNVWVVGGGDLAAQFADAGLLDELILSSSPWCWAAASGCCRWQARRRHLSCTASRAMGRGIVELRYLLKGSGS
jgi:riboflavin biosynthesis pyrimidine reductase